MRPCLAKTIAADEHQLNSCTSTALAATAFGLSRLQICGWPISIRVYAYAYVNTYRTAAQPFRAAELQAQTERQPMARVRNGHNSAVQCSAALPRNRPW